jgi:hypothetical protein
MGQVHEIVNEKLIIALDLIGAALENPLWIRAPGEFRNPGFIGEFGTPDPNPDEAMSLNDGIDADSRISVNARLTGIQTHSPHGLNSSPWYLQIR